VSRKQEGAGDYCRRVLKAWAGWDRDQDVSRRDKKIAAAAADLAKGWAKNEAKAAEDEVDCADTTASSSAVGAFIDSATGALVEAVNMGLDLDEKAGARCGRRLLEAAARKCSRLLGAESDLVRNPARDPHRTRHDTAAARASEDFTEAFDKQRRL